MIEGISNSAEGIFKTGLQMGLSMGAAAMAHNLSPNPKTKALWSGVAGASCSLFKSGYDFYTALSQGKETDQTNDEFFLNLIEIGVGTLFSITLMTPAGMILSAALSSFCIETFRTKIQGKTTSESIQSALFAASSSILIGGGMTILSWRIAAGRIQPVDELPRLKLSPQEWEKLPPEVRELTSSNALEDFIDAAHRSERGIASPTDQVFLGFYEDPSRDHPAALIDLARRKVRLGHFEKADSTFNFRGDSLGLSLDNATLLYPKNLQAGFPLSEAVVVTRSGEVMHWTDFFNQQKWKSTGTYATPKSPLPLETGGLFLRQGETVSWSTRGLKKALFVYAPSPGVHRVSRSSFDFGSPSGWDLTDETQVTLWIHSHPTRTLGLTRSQTPQVDLLSATDLKCYLNLRQDLRQDFASAIYTTGAPFNGSGLSIFIPRPGTDFSMDHDDFEREFRRCFRTLTIEFLEEGHQLRVGTIQEF
ncbi:MAG: hypothetical protein HYT76_00845 [Deltaproteobacteria bacterium]|nr:hypothetical protein [Deltaproteobacteria bacterium]